MLFNSTDFFIFLPIVLIGSRVLAMPWRNWFLLAASYYFYGSWDWRFLGLLMLTTATDFVVAQAIHRSHDALQRRRLLLVSIAVNLGILATFKYLNFFIGSGTAFLESLGFEVHAWTLQLILPVSISFYTFQSMSYSIDVYRRNLEPVTSLRDYALYVAYFPQLVAGPIERASNLLPQLTAPKPVNAGRINTGILLLVTGFTKKVLIADWVATEVDRIFAAPGEMSSGELLRGGYLFAFQIYSDFAGYTDIARGVSELFGVRLMSNFRQPYLSQSITEFWRRWHISLSTWLRDYLYIPLGGNRHGRFKTYRNLFLTMLIGGLWHGANWTFVVWGGLHGTVLAIERALGVDQRGPDGRRLTLRGLAGMVITFHIAAWLFVVFRAPDIETAAIYFVRMWSFQGVADVGMFPLAVAAALLVIDLPQWWADRETILLRIPWWVRSPVYAGLAIMVIGKIVYGGRDMPFIYFQF